MIKTRDGTDFFLDNSGRSLAETGYTVLFPDKDSFMKHPLDPVSAWEEWKASHKPQIWRAEQEQDFYWIDLTEIEGGINSEKERNLPEHNTLNKIGNYFHSAEAAKEARRAIEKLLESFHEANDPKPENETNENKEQLDNDE